MLGPIQNLLAEINGPLSATQHNDVEILQRNAGRLLKLVNALLDFSRIEAGRATATYAPTDIGGVTRELAGAFRSAIEHAGIGFEVACDTLDEPVFVDRDMWEKIVLNLLSNALKFTPSGGQITLICAEHDDTVSVTVQDTGRGIALEKLASIFEPFVQVDRRFKREQEGIGLGLAISRELARAMGGDLTAASVEGAGSTFELRLPKVR